MIGHQDYTVENLNDTIGYQNYIAEMLDKSIDYSNMLAEEQNKSIAHTDYLVEKMEQMIDHQDYLAENMNHMVGYQEYLAENIDNTIKHQDYIVENLNENNYNNNENIPVVEENKVKTEVEKEETPKFDSKKYQSEITEQLMNLIKTAKTQYEEERQRAIEAIEESRQACTESTNFNLINHIPTRLQEKWTKLSDERKKEILNESKMFLINNIQTAEYFWNTRDLREKQIEVSKIEENVTANVAPQTGNVLDNDRYRMLSEQIKRRMGI